MPATLAARCARAALVFAAQTCSSSHVAAQTAHGDLEEAELSRAVFDEECAHDGADTCDLSLLQKRARQAQQQKTAIEVVGNTAEMSNATEEAPTFTFYVYRSMSYKEWPFGNVNAGNLPGVMWYLTNEVLPRCPKRYNITQIKRYKITYKATPELYSKGMNFGVRYSYDAGKCTGSNTIRMKPCSWAFERYGHILGCNNFKDRYPWPAVGTAYPDGIWYDLPLEGRCDNPTGAHDCTWSYEDAGQVLIEEELEAQYKGPGYYCHGRSTKFWGNSLSTKSGKWRVRKVMNMFAKKYPDMPADLPQPPCDFNKHVFFGS